MLQWISKMPSCGSNAGMEMSAPLAIAVVINTLFHSNSHVNQMLHQIIPILHCYLVDSLLKCCNQLDWSQGCLMATNLEFIEVTMIS